MDRVLQVSLLSAATAWLLGPLVDPDLWWHLTIGNWIVSSGAVPHTELWNKFALGTPFVAYSWAFEVLISLTHRYFAELGLLSLKFLLLLTFIACLVVAFQRICQRTFEASFVALLVTIGIIPLFTLRPQSFVWIYLTIVLLIAELIRREGFSKVRSLSLFLVLCLWSNFHITTIFALPILFFWIFDRASIAKSFFAVGIALAGTLFTPYYGREWLITFSKGDHPLAYNLISEFQPATVFDYPVAILVILLVLFLVLRIHHNRTLPELKELFIIPLAIVGLAIIKFIPFAIIYSAFLVVSNLNRTPTPSNVERDLRRLKEVLEKIPKDGLSFVAICVVVISLVPLSQAPVDKNVIPERELDLILEQKLPLPILNEFGRGGYVMYRFSDKDGNILSPVVIDGRTNVNPAFVWQAFQRAELGIPGWESFIEVTNPGTILWRKEKPFTSLLRLLPDWCEVGIADPALPSDFAIFVRKRYVHENLSSQQEFLNLDSCLIG